MPFIGTLNCLQSMKEAIEVCQNLSMWRDVVYAYSNGEKA